LIVLVYCHARSWFCLVMIDNACWYCKWTFLFGNAHAHFWFCLVILGNAHAHNLNGRSWFWLVMFGNAHARFLFFLVMLVYNLNGCSWFCLVMLVYCHAHSWFCLVMLGNICFCLYGLVNGTLCWCENSPTTLAPQNRNIIGIILLVVNI